MIKFISIIIMLVIPSTAFGWECSEKLDYLSQQTGTNIFCKISSIEQNKKVKITEAEQYMIDRSYPAIKIFLSSYDNKILRNKIKQILLFKKIYYLDSEVGGLSDGSTIWLCLDDYAEYKMPQVYVKILHHEFSSNIYKSTPLYQRFAWKNINYMYNDSIEFLKKCLNNFSYCEETSEKLLRNGYIKNYSLTNDENDFNVFAETLFTHPQKMILLKQKYPFIDKKLTKLKEFYRDAGFSKKFPDES